jgi:hypothetical protein
MLYATATFAPAAPLNATSAAIANAVHFLRPEVLVSSAPRASKETSDDSQDETQRS